MGDTEMIYPKISIMGVNEYFNRLAGRNIETLYGNVDIITGATKSSKLLNDSIEKVLKLFLKSQFLETI